MSYVQSVRLHNSRVLFLIRFSDALFFVPYVWKLQVEVSKKMQESRSAFFNREIYWMCLVVGPKCAPWL